MDLKKPFYIIAIITVLITVFTISSPLQPKTKLVKNPLRQQIKVEIVNLQKSIDRLSNAAKPHSKLELEQELRSVQVQLDASLDRLGKLVQIDEEHSTMELYCDARVSQHQLNSALTTNRTKEAVCYFEQSVKAAKKSLAKIHTAGK